MIYDIISVGCLSYDIVLNIPFFPKINSECFVKSLFQSYGGGAANFAAYSSFYGGLKTGLVSNVGNDPISKKLVNRMKIYKVCTKGIQIKSNYSNTQIFIIRYPDGKRSYLVNLGAIKGFDINDLPKEYILNSKLYYIAPATFKIHREVINLIKEYSPLIVFNPGSVYFEQENKSNLNKLLKFVEFLFLNKSEAFFYSNKQSIYDAGYELLKKGVKYVIITAEDIGGFLFHNDQYKLYPRYKVEIKNNIGAGDAFAAGFIKEYLKSENVNSAMKMGNVYAAFRVMQSEMLTKNPNKGKFLAFLNNFNQI